jgi:hypothetical protein
MSKHDVCEAFYKIFEHLAKNPDQRNITFAKWIISNSISELKHLCLDDFNAEEHLIKLGLAEEFIDEKGFGRYVYYPNLEKSNIKKSNFKTTAIYPNRLEDKKELENKMGLSEEGNDNTIFDLLTGMFFAIGYTRIVYGDHGPYVEFDRKHIQAGLASVFGNKIDFDNLPEPEESKYYFYWLRTTHVKNPHLGYEDVKVYLQIKPVTDLPNAPKRSDGKRSCFNRKEGYADYRRGFFYVDPYQLSVRQGL